MSRPYAEVIGDPIAHSKSPLIHNFWLQKLGIDAEYRACHVGPDELESYFTRRREDAKWRGCNVTIPHKVVASSFVDAVEPGAAKIGAVNTIIAKGRALVGTNTDDVGFIDPMRHFPATLQRATLIGAGGAARAILGALSAMGLGSVTIVNRDQSKAFDLVSEFPIIRAVAALSRNMSIEPTDLLVNATSLGMVGQPPLEIDIERLDPATIVYDAVYAPLDTCLLSAARRRGCTTIDGLQMLVGQAAAAFSFLFRYSAPREHDAELRALLTA